MSADSGLENSTDPDIEVLTVSGHILSNKEKRLKLLDFLLYSPPPEPLHWVTFHDYIVKQFSSYYSEEIIKEVFRLIDRTITKTRYVSAVIDLESEDENSITQGVPGNKGSRKRDSDFQTLSQPLNIQDPGDEHLQEAERTVLSSSANVPFPCETDDLKKDRNVKKIFSDIYSLLKEINDSTSCRICAKLKFRLEKFHEIINTKESEQVEKSVLSELVENRENSEQGPRKRKSSYYQKMRSLFLTEKEVEKVRKAILLDELLDVSLTDLTTSVTQKSMQSIEQEKAIPSLKKKSKKKKMELDITESCTQISGGADDSSGHKNTRKSADDPLSDCTESSYTKTYKKVKKDKKSSKRRDSAGGVLIDFTDSCSQTKSEKTKRKTSAHEDFSDSADSGSLTKSGKTKRKKSAYEDSSDAVDSCSRTKSQKTKRKKSALEDPSDSADSCSRTKSQKTKRKKSALEDPSDSADSCSLTKSGKTKRKKSAYEDSSDAADSCSRTKSQKTKRKKSAIEDPSDSADSCSLTKSGKTKRKKSAYEDFSESTDSCIRTKSEEAKRKKYAYEDFSESTEVAESTLRKRKKRKAEKESTP